MAQTNVLAVSAASEALKDEDFYKFSLNKANAEKDKIYKLLDYLNLKYIKSSTNFVFFESKKHINELSEQMLEKGVMVGRPFPIIHFMTGVELVPEQVKRLMSLYKLCLRFMVKIFYLENRLTVT